MIESSVAELYDIVKMSQEHVDLHIASICEKLFLFVRPETFHNKEFQGWNEEISGYTLS